MEKEHATTVLKAVYNGHCKMGGSLQAEWRTVQNCIQKMVDAAVEYYSEDGELQFQDESIPLLVWFPADTSLFKQFIPHTANDVFKARCFDGFWDRETATFSHLDLPNVSVEKDDPQIPHQMEKWDMVLALHADSKERFNYVLISVEAVCSSTVARSSSFCSLSTSCSCPAFSGLERRRELNCNSSIAACQSR